MEIILTTGSLGAGKTTVVCSLVEALQDREIVYVVNDAGSIAFDAVRVNVPATERLLAGCVCCEDVASLTKTLHKVGLEKPDAVVIVEPSGLADASQILDAVQILGMRLNIIHLHVVNAQLDTIQVVEEVRPSAFIVNRFADESEYDLWQQSTSTPVIAFQPGDSAEALIHLNPLQLLLLSGATGKSMVHHGYFIQNLQVPAEREDELLSLLQECSSNGILQRAKGKLSAGCLSANSSGVTVFEDTIYDELPEGVILVIGKRALKETFASFDISSTQLELLLEAYRNLALMKKAPNTNAEGQLLVANDCDRAQLITYDITDPALASKLRYDVFNEMVRWRLASMALLDSCVGTPEQKLFWEHSLAAKLGYLMGEHPEDLTEEHQEEILKLQVFRRYFSTMQALDGVESSSFTLPTQHDEKPWVFWEMLRNRAELYDELSAEVIDQIVEHAVGRPEGDLQAVAFYEHRPIES